MKVYSQLESALSIETNKKKLKVNEEQVIEGKKEHDFL